MSDDIDFQMPTPDPALKRLEFLVGTWELTGHLEAGPAGPAGEISGRETFEWLEGGFFLVHRWEGTMDFGGTTMADIGYEFFDFVPRTGTFRTRFFNNLGPYDEAGSSYTGDFDGDGLVVIGPARITRTPDGDDRIAYDGDLPDGQGGWIPWMHATLTRVR